MYSNAIITVTYQLNAVKLYMYNVGEEQCDIVIPGMLIIVQYITHAATESQIRYSDVGNVFKYNMEVQQTSDCYICLLYTSPSPRDATLSRMPSSA